MDWRHRLLLERFIHEGRPLTFHQTPGAGEKTWKAAMQNGWIERVNPQSKALWWMDQWQLSQAGREAML